jgi:predicted dehydrogenase
MSEIKNSSRRTFLGSSAALLSAAGQAAAKPSKKTPKPGIAARSATRVIGANDRINTGHIGVGGMGGSHVRAFYDQSQKSRDIQVAAVCDIYTRRKERARTVAHLETKDVFHDYRELLARPDIDAVLIASPDHWHAQMALDALAAGKDVYLQKPMTYTIEEARAVAEATKKFGRVLQVGSQGLSAATTHKMREVIERGELGELLWAQSTSSRNSILGEWNWRVEPEGTPETIDWKRWIGPAPNRPFSLERYFRWRKYWDYSGGIATDLFYHSLGPILFAMGAQFPTCVTANGGIYVQKDREVPDTYASTIEYPGFYIALSGSMANAAGVRHHGLAIYGHKATLSLDSGKVVVTPEALTIGSFDKKKAVQPKIYEVPLAAESHRAHTDNFFACMRSRKAPNLNADLGYQIMAAIRLGVDAYRDRQAKLFDPKAAHPASKLPRRPEWEGDGKNHENDPEIKKAVS